MGAGALIPIEKKSLTEWGLILSIPQNDTQRKDEKYTFWKGNDRAHSQCQIPEWSGNFVRVSYTYVLCKKWGLAKNMTRIFTDVTQPAETRENKINQYLFLLL